MRVDMPMDVGTQFRTKASVPSDSYVRILNLPGMLVNAGMPQRIVNRPTGAFMVMLQASLTNAGIIYVGGPTCDVASGLELDGGRGVLFSTDPNPTQSQLGVSGFSHQQLLADASIPRSWMLIEMYEISVTASINGQGLRIMYMIPNR